MHHPRWDGKRHKTEPICAVVLLDVFRQIPTGRQFQNNLERSRSDTKERDDVDANPCTVECPFIYITKTLRGYRVATDVQERR